MQREATVSGTSSFVTFQFLQPLHANKVRITVLQERFKPEQFESQKVSSNRSDSCWSEPKPAWASLQIFAAQIVEILRMHFVPSSCSAPRVLCFCWNAGWKWVTFRKQASFLYLTEPSDELCWISCSCAHDCVTPHTSKHWESHSVHTVRLGSKKFRKMGCQKTLPAHQCDCLTPPTKGNAHLFECGCVKKCVKCDPQIERNVYIKLTKYCILGITVSQLNVGWLRCACHGVNFPDHSSESCPHLFPLRLNGSGWKNESSVAQPFPGWTPELHSVCILYASYTFRPVNGASWSTICMKRHEVWESGENNRVVVNVRTRKACKRAEDTYNRRNLME